MRNENTTRIILIWIVCIEVAVRPDAYFLVNPLASDTSSQDLMIIILKTGNRSSPVDIPQDTLPVNDRNAREDTRY